MYTLYYYYCIHEHRARVSVKNKHTRVSIKNHRVPIHLYVLTARCISVYTIAAESLKRFPARADSGDLVRTSCWATDWNTHTLATDLQCTNAHAAGHTRNNNNNNI